MSSVSNTIFFPSNLLIFLPSTYFFTVALTRASETLTILGHGGGKTSTKLPFLDIKKLLQLEEENIVELCFFAKEGEDQDKILFEETGDNPEFADEVVLVSQVRIIEYLRSLIFLSFL